MRTTSLIYSLLGLLLVLSLGACSTANVGTFDAPALDGSRQSAGVSLGGFEVIRYSAAGFPDPALNDTLSLRLENKGDGSALVISVADPTFTTTVALDVNYNASSIHPDRAVFHGLLGDTAHVLSASFLDEPGVAAIGECAIGSFTPVALTGEFATLYFAKGSARATSASGDVHQNPDGVADTIEGIANLTQVSDVPGQTATVTWTGGWHLADGDQNSEVNIADMTPIGFFFGQSTAVNWAAVRGDYDHNTEVNISDLTEIGRFFGQVTENYVISGGDDAGGPQTAMANILWIDADPFDSNNAVPGALYPAFSRWQFEVTATSTPNYTTLTGLDTDGNGWVRVYITPHEERGTPGDGVVSTIDVQVGGVLPEADRLTITGYDIQVVGATGGTGLPNNDIFGPGFTDLGVTANQDVTLQLNSIEGTFNAGNFDGGTTPITLAPGMDQTDYDTALDAARTALRWDVSHAGAVGFRRSDNWLVGPTFPMNGDPGDAVVFPDDDLESDAATPEAGMTTRLPGESEFTYPSDSTLEVHVLSALLYTFAVDVTVDTTAVVIGSYMKDQFTPLTELTLSLPTFGTSTLDWATTIPPTDLSTTQLQLLRIEPDPNNTGRGVAVGTPIDLTYAETNLQPGQYGIRQDPVSEQWSLSFVINGVLIQPTPDPGEGYVLRFNWGQVWSSVNLPPEMLLTTDPPPAQDLLPIPARVFPAIDQMMLYYQDPVVRRDPRMAFNPITSAFEPKDQIGFDDVLKSNGDEFVLSRLDAVTYPLIGLQKTNNPALIVEPGEAAPNQAGILFVERNPHRLVIDIAVISTGGSVGDPDETYSLVVFGPGNARVGQCTFDMAFIEIPPGPPVGQRWGINVWNREAMEVADRVAAFDDFDLDGSSIAVGAPAPDVIWVEFGDGWMYDIEEDPAAMSGSNNVKLLIEDEVSAEQAFMYLVMRIVGVTAAGDMLAIHPVVPGDFRNPTLPGGGFGRLVPGHTYTLSLDDPHNPGVDFTFDRPSDHSLSVSGTNPNE